MSDFTKLLEEIGSQIKRLGKRVRRLEQIEAPVSAVIKDNEPSYHYPGKLWVIPPTTDVALLKVRNEANTGWWDFYGDIFPGPSGGAIKDTDGDMITPDGDGAFNLVEGPANIDVDKTGDHTITFSLTGPAADSYVVPAITFGAANVEGIANSLIRSDATLALGITCPDANTVYPDAVASNRWSLTSIGGTITITGAVANTVNFEIVPGAGCYWQRVGTVLSPKTSGDDVTLYDSGDLSFYDGAPGNLTAYVTGADGSGHFAEDKDITSYMGRAALGYCGHANYASISHFDVNTITGYGLITGPAATVMNVSTGGNTAFKLYGAEDLELYLDAGFTLTGQWDGLSGDINLADGAVIGNIGGAGPEITFDDMNNRLTVTGAHLRVGYDTNLASYLGRAAIGYDGATADTASFAHIDYNSATSYGLAQNAVGRTSINAAAGQYVTVRINNDVCMYINATAAQVWNGVDLEVHSGAGGTLVASIDGATGNLWLHANATTHFGGGTYIWPANEGGGGSVLSSNGASPATLTWVAAGAPPATPWTDTGAFLHPTNARDVKGDGGAAPGWELLAAGGALFRGKVGVNTAVHANFEVQITGTTLWAGGIAAGGSEANVVLGELTNIAWLGGHNAALSAWADLYIGNTGVDTIFQGDVKVWNAEDILVYDAAPGNLMASIDGATGYIACAGWYVGIDGDTQIGSLAGQNIMLHPTGGQTVIIGAGHTLHPETTNTTSLGDLGTPLRWSNVVSVLGNFSGNVDIGAGCDVTGNITVTGTVDGVDISAFKAAYDAHTHAISGNTALTQPTLSGKTSGFIAGAADDWISSIYDGGHSSNSWWFRAYDTAAHATAGGSTGLTAIQLVAHRNEHHHNLTGAGDYGWGTADAAVSSHAHAKGTLATGAP